ncbi:hypothetical protein TJA_21390 [Thermus sp. LT1-2-5]
MRVTKGKALQLFQLHDGPIGAQDVQAGLQEGLEGLGLGEVVGKPHPPGHQKPPRQEVVPKEKSQLALLQKRRARAGFRRLAPHHPRDALLSQGEEARAGLRVLGFGGMGVPGGIQ